MSNSVAVWKYIITHVFCPLQLPDGNDHSIHNDCSLARVVADAAFLYIPHVDQANLSQWHSILQMLRHLQFATQSETLYESRVISQFNSMFVGDVLALPIRAQNAGVIFRKMKDVTIFESFELSPKAKDVMATEGKLICSYPGPAISIPNLVFDDENFRFELVNFLVHMDQDDLNDVALASQQQQPSVFDDTVHPGYVTELLTGILRSVGSPATIPRISKRIGDDVVCNGDSKLPWRRSALWVLIRVALQTTLDRSSLGLEVYKEFMLFFMCRIAEQKTCADLPSHLLQFIVTKISRRLRKLGSLAPAWLSQVVFQTCTSLRSIIEDRWKEVQAVQRQSPLWDPSQLNLFRDIRLSLSSSGEYIFNALVNHSIPPSKGPVNPTHHRRGTLDDFLSSDGWFFENAYRVEPHTTLFDVERAIEQGIDDWVSQVTINDKACVKLEILADKYSSCALGTYANNPELLSIMLLTTIEIWVALDKIAVKEIPILSDYSPEVPISLLENLLLCKTIRSHRLYGAHEYLSRRHSQSRSQWSVFSSVITANNFAVRFFRQSSHLQHLKAQIEGAARRQYREKVAELWRENARYAVLWIGGRRDPVTIEEYEWPLPANRLHAEVVVFELDCPVSFNMWRTATFRLLVDLCSSPIRQRGRPPTELDSYQVLSPYFVKHFRSRITLGSTLWPSDHRILFIPAKQGEVCIKNRLSFFAFDTLTGVPVSEALGRSDCRGICKYRLPSGPYHDLQKFVVSTSHTSNEVIASQFDCHKDLSIHEYTAFGHLRSGGLLQWLNILRELRGRSLNFRCPEVHMLFAQTVSEVGPLANTGWEWHREIEHPTFCFALLCELGVLIRDVEANWKEAVTMDTISFLLCRLLSSSPDQAVSQEALGLLRTVRGKVFCWVQELSTELVRKPRMGECHGVLRDTAAICRSTFDVDPAMIRDLLHSPEDIEVLLSCAVIIHDHIPSNVSQLSAYSRLLLDRDRRLSMMLEGVIKGFSQADSHDQGINLAVGRIWPDYHPGSKWCPLDEPNSRWFSCTTAPPSDQRPQVVLLNILDGSLLVDGRPLGTWLPNEIVQHPQYRLILGGEMLQVIPGDLPGMDYCTRDSISNHVVYFSLRNNGSNLIVRARRKQAVPGDPEIIELIPHDKLEGDLPAVLIEGHAHWLNLSTCVMEIRPLSNVWETSSENWKISCIRGHYRMQKGHDYFVDVRSRSWYMLSRLLRPLAASKDLIISVSTIAPNDPLASFQLSVVLPRYDLSFFVDEDGDLQSSNMRGMVYDNDQFIGTLFGLVNQLVLRPKIKDVDVNAVELIPRCVIIPEGVVSFQTEDHHVCVEITPHCSFLERVTYQTYKVNTDLGCLTGNGGLTSKLYCTFLHALTSGSSVDPLTGRTGTEEALSVLQSASCWSSVRLCPHDAELLCLIASICPSRRWYSNQQVQQVEWRNLPPNSQHPDFFFLSRSIKEHHEKLQLFHESPSSVSFQGFPLQGDHLLKRGARHAAYLFPFGSPGQLSAANIGVLYSGRDIMEVASGEQRACTAATYVYLRNAPSGLDIGSMLEKWKRMSGNTVLSLRYERSWLAPDPIRIWFKAYNLLRRSDDRKWFQLLFSLPSMAYGSDLGELVPMFVAFASHSKFQFEDPPQYDPFLIAQRSVHLRGYVFDCAHRFEHSPEILEPRRPGESDNGLRERQFELYYNRVYSDAHAIADELARAQCPWETFPPYTLDASLYDVASFESQVLRQFFDPSRNFTLRRHLERIETILIRLPGRSPRVSLYSFYPSRRTSSRISWKLTIDQLFRIRPAPPLRAHDELPRLSADVHNTSHPDSTALHQLIAAVGAKAANPFQHQYISALRTSAQSCKSEMLVYPAVTKHPTAELLVEHYTRCKTSYIEALHLLQRYLGPRSQSEGAVELAGQWPRITAHALFPLLTSKPSTTLPDDWKKCLISYTLIALELQRARRLLLLHFNDLQEELGKELQNEGCDGWNAEAHPEWLLIQLQGNFLIRPVQAEVAIEMISPRSGENTAMQLNMGEGKTSVIVPIVVSALANGNQLVRVIVPKPLTTQTLHVLVDRLSGLANRRVYYVPFSRSLELNSQKLTSLYKIMLECMEERGILVVQPEHVLSLKLVTVEKQLYQEDSLVANLLFELQKWLHSHSRDILDESDEILDVRSQLVFTIGHQQHVEGSPERWTTTQQVLSLVGKHASALRELFPLGVEYEPGPPGSFPYLRILQKGAGEKLISWIVQDVIEGHIPNISLGYLLHSHSNLKDAIRSFLSCQVVPPADVQSVKKHFGQTSLWGILLLLHGLLANDILLFAFRERRWRVDYGLASTRTMLAVPYRAKDVPAQRAEFGHPDIAIVLTCLSYYYAGLSEEQLRLSFGILFKQHDPSIDYDLWLQACPSVPTSLQNISGVNIESAEQWNEFLFPLFSRNRATVDFYISRVVFPREAKEFPTKLSSSGWDLAEKKDRLLTGFSGTNDGQYLLPLHITQHDPDHQRGTNARVLSYILQPENNHYLCMTPENDRRPTTYEFLETLAGQKPEIRVLLDVGAQMLDLQNYELAKSWLDIIPNASAAIYFNEVDELTVCTRDGHTQLLLSSPYAEQLDQCIFYLDDVHTRGTDIKFPIGFRAGVTLGPKVTKDRLVQGCMRMRKLGHGHSIMFFAHLAVDQRIRSVVGKDLSVPINTTDILQWAIRETWDYTQRLAPHWVQQGMDHESRYATWNNFCKGQVTSKELSDKWLQQEAKTLSDLYEPRDPLNPAFLTWASPDIRQRCVDHAVSSLWSVGMDEEQEREVVYEVIRERQVERPPKAQPAKHSIHPDVVNFIKTGVIFTRTNFSGTRIQAFSTAFTAAFKTLDATSATCNEAFIWGQSVLVTADFEQTVIESSGKIDNYLRPVHWIISAKTNSGDVFVIPSPFEANYLLPIIRSSDKVHLHLYTPCITKSMKLCDGLALYSIPMVPDGWITPSSLMDQLNVFAGQLYLKDYETYIRLCRFLCVYARDLEGEEGIVVEPDGFILPKNRVHLKRLRGEGGHTFANTPLVAIKALMSLRSKDIDISLTHMGNIVRGHLLSEDDFDS